MKVTSWQTYCNRRKFLRLSGSLIASGAFAASGVYALSPSNRNDALAHQITPFEAVTSYNNYYEFSSNKKSVKRLAQSLIIQPWTVKISGEVEQEISISLAELIKIPHVSRTYPLRCVEGWSAVIPWQGIELSRILRLAVPKSTAKYVSFESVFRPKQMLNQRRKILPWPYREALTIDEATHPLTLLATGMYNQNLTKQNGAPVRLVVPWKYGFKSIKAVSEIRLTQDQPKTSWNTKKPEEYGFYANVNPNVPHPRWSQAREVRLGELSKRPTKMFNGFEKEVSYLYSESDLNINF